MLVAEHGDEPQPLAIYPGQDGTSVLRFHGRPAREFANLWDALKWVDGEEFTYMKKESGDGSTHEE